MLLASFAAAIGLALLHLLAGKLTFLRGRPRDVWLSAAGGLSVAFVFVYLLPQMASRHAELQESASNITSGIVTHNIFVLILIGMIAFLALERFAKATVQRPAPGSRGPNKAPVFWAHMASFMVYNLVIGYMLVNEQNTLHDLLLFFSAIALHFLVLDFSFREHYELVYHQKGRWLLASAVIAGWCLGQGLELPRAAVSMAMAFVAGGIILNVLKEELPEEKQSRFLPFLTGATVYTAIALAYVH